MVRSHLHIVLLPLALLANLAAIGRSDDASAQSEPKVDAATIKRLVEQLGADEFAAREDATEQLTRIGLPAYKAVEEATQHNDREIRYRAERVLARIRQSDLQRRLEAFQRGGEDGADYQLPGWSRFKKTYGDNGNVRSVFVDLVKADADLLQALESNPRSIADVVTNRVQLYQQLQAQFVGRVGLQLSFGQVGALIFAATQDDVQLNANQLAIIISYCRQGALGELVSNGSRGGVPRQMLANLITHANDAAAYQAMELGRAYNMKEALVPAEKILKGGAVRQGYMTCMALSLVATLGDESHEPLVEKLLTDKTLVTQIQEKDKILRKLEVRDAALAALLYLTKQDLRDYFTIPNGLQVTDPRMVMTNVRALGFTEEQQREAVHQKWREWREKNPSKAKNEEKNTDNNDKPADK
jgi:hypothetical protein